MATLYAQPATNARVGYNPEHAGDYIVAVAEFDIAVDNSGTAIATNDIVEMLKLPAECVIVDCILDTDAIASGVVDVGIAVADSGTNDELLDGKSTASAAAFRADKAGFTRLAASTSERAIAVKFATGSAATTGKFRLTLMYRAKDYSL